MNVLFEDENIIVIVKEPGEPSQADKTGDKDIPMLIKEQKGTDVFVVHRLDRPVGGVMVYAKDAKTASLLTQQLKESTMNKKYYAVVNGKPDKDSKEVLNYIITDTRKNISKVVSGPKVKGAKEARLNYSVIDYDNEKDISLLDVELFTGRHHQIRVQLSSEGIPIWGDIKYNKSFLRKRTLPALWSYSLEINHPEKGKLIFVKLPEKEPFSFFEKSLKKY